jgi:MFS transporter, ACS family, aldohexuronate transporter
MMFTLSEPASTLATPATSVPPDRFRWTICAMLFWATTLAYIDRQVFSLLAPDLQTRIGWNEQQYGYMITAFQGAYAIGLFFVGRLIDRFGTRIGYSVVVAVWGLAAAAHGLATSAFTFGLARFFLGIGESGNFPAAIKTTAEWFPKKERAFATGIFNSGSNIGAVIAPIFVPIIAINFGWRWAFVVSPLLGLLWIICWVNIRRQPRADQNEKEVVLAAPSWRELLTRKGTYAFAIGKFLTDPAWWFYLYWLPKFFHTKFNLTLDKLGLPLVIIYVAADIGSIGGGWLSSFLIGRGMSVRSARRIAMFICAACAVPILTVTHAGSVWYAVFVLSLATAGHQGWSANLYTLVSDIFPKNAVASVIGMGGMAGSVGGMIFSASAGYILQTTGSYVTLFAMAALTYLVAFGIIQTLQPRRTT